MFILLGLCTVTEGDLQAALASPLGDLTGEGNSLPAAFRPKLFPKLLSGCCGLLDQVLAAGLVR